jgi:hypothetical protein
VDAAAAAAAIAARNTTSRSLLSKLHPSGVFLMAAV